MILKLKVNKTPRGYEPSDVFYLNGFLEYKELSLLLLSARLYIQACDVEKILLFKNEVHLDVTVNGTTYKFKPLTKIPFVLDEVEEAVCRVAEITKDKLYIRDRSVLMCTAKSVLFSACIYFGGMTYSHIRRRYNYKTHAAIMHLRRITLPSMILSKDIIALDLVNAICGLFHDDSFMRFCSEYKSYNSSSAKKETRPEKFINVWGYRGITSNYGKWQAQIKHNRTTINLGLYASPHQAAKAYNDYVAANKLQRRLNYIQ